MALRTIMTGMAENPKTAPTAMLTVVRGIGANERTITRVPTTMALMKLNSPHICRKCLRASDNDSITGRSPSPCAALISLALSTRRVLILSRNILLNARVWLGAQEPCPYRMELQWADPAADTAEVSAR